MIGGVEQGWWWFGFGLYFVNERERMNGREECGTAEEAQRGQVFYVDAGRVQWLSQHRL